MTRMERMKMRMETRISLLSRERVTMMLRMRTSRMEDLDIETSSFHKADELSQ